MSRGIGRVHSTGCFQENPGFTGAILHRWVSHAEQRLRLLSSICRAVSYDLDASDKSSPAQGYLPPAARRDFFGFQVAACRKLF